MRVADDWRDRAACTFHDPELFFPLGTARSALTQSERVPQVCQHCPVQGAWLDFAVRTGAD